VAMVLNTFGRIDSPLDFNDWLMEHSGYVQGIFTLCEKNN